MPDAEFSEAATYLPNQENTFLGSVEFQAVVSAIEDKVNPDTENSSEAKKRGNYNHYSPEIRAKIGKYASENGNSKEIKHFKAEIPNLKEGTDLGLGLFISGAISHAEQEPLPSRRYHVGFLKNASLLISQISTEPSHNIKFSLNW